MAIDDMVEPAGAVRPLPAGELLDIGVTPGELTGPGWTSPFRGVYRPPDPTRDPSPLQRILDVAELLPVGAALGGWAAAHLLGATELDGRGWSGQQTQPVPVVLPPPVLIRARTGLTRWRSVLEDDDVVLVDGIPVTSPVRTCFDLVRRSQLRDGVIVLDVLGRQLRLSPATVSGYAQRHRKWRGLPRVAPAVELADVRARSTGETRLRLTWILDAKLPRPEVNPRVLDLEGQLVAEADLLDPEAGVVVEHDGSQHRDLPNHVLDNAREEWVEDTGLIVVRTCSPDLWAENRRRTALRLQVAHRRGSSRDRSRDRWTWTPRDMP
jgi:hypothetical protein